MTLLDSRSRRAEAGHRVVGDLAWNGERWQRWNGKKWKSALFSLQPDLLRAEASPPTWPELPPHRLDRVLALAVERHVMDYGGTVIHEGPHGPVLGYPKTVNHLLYAVLTVVTFGIGAFFWLLAVLEKREERIQLQVDKWVMSGASAARASDDQPFAAPQPCHFSTRSHALVRGLSWSGYGLPP